jgi:nitronate monooxygenase
MECRESAKNKRCSGNDERRLPLIEAIKGAAEIKQILNLSLRRVIRLGFQMMTAKEDSPPLWVLAREAAGARRHLMSINDGNLEEGILFTGQCCGGIDDMPGCQELIERIVAEAEEIIKATTEKLY